ncbi:uncharacterized protein WCC33_017942 [Rhinophrynus dorsalis]
MSKRCENKITIRKETDPLLPKNCQKTPKRNKCKKAIKKIAAPIHVFFTSKSNKQEKTFKELLENLQYQEACEFISKLEQNDEDLRLLYNEVADKMWRTLTKALNGEKNHKGQMNSIAACIKWAKSHEFRQESDWSPKMWEKKLEELIKKHIEKEHFPTFVCNSKTKMSIKQHLDELEKKCLQRMDVERSVLGDLFAVYVKCLPVCMLHHLSSLALNDFPYEEFVLLYRWSYEEYKRLRRYQQEVEDFDPLLFDRWFSENGKKVICIGQKTIQKALREILEKEIGWNMYPAPEHDFYFNDILKFACLILVWNTLDYLGKIPQEKTDLDLEIKRIICQCEDRGVTFSCVALKSTMKNAFQNHFTKDGKEFEDVLKQMQSSLQHAGVQTNEMFIRTIHHTVVVLYIQTFFRFSKKCEIFSKGSKRLQDTFEALVSDKGLLDNPMEYISHILSAKDTESLKTTTMFLSHYHPDLREEHLNTIMNLKGNLSSEERENLLCYLKNRKTDFHEDKMCFFEDIEVKQSRWKFLCCQ